MALALLTMSSRAKKKDSSKGKKKEGNALCCKCKGNFKEDDNMVLICEICEESIICGNCLNMPSENTYQYLSTRSDLIFMCDCCRNAKSLTLKFLQPEILTISEKFDEKALRMTGMEETLKSKADLAEVSSEY